MWIEELDRLAEAYIQDLKTNFPYVDLSNCTGSVTTPQFVPKPAI